MSNERMQSTLEEASCVSESVIINVIEIHFISLNVMYYICCLIIVNKAMKLNQGLDCLA